MYKSNPYLCIYSFLSLSIKINQVNDSTTPYLSNYINDLKLNFNPIFGLKKFERNARKRK